MSKKPKIFDELSRIAPLIPTPVYWLDTDFVIVGGNDLCLDAIGSNAKTINEVLIGKTYYDYYPKDIADELTKMIKIVIETNQAIKAEEKITDVRTGNYRFFETVRAPLFDEDGQIVGTICTAVEITDKKNAEKLMFENQKHQVEKEQQEKFNKIVGQMVHDIQSPLSSLSSLLNQSSSKLPEDERNLVHNVLNSITSITNHVLNRYRNEPESEDEQKQPVFVYGLMQEIISEKRYEYKDKPIEFIIEVEKENEFSFIKIEPSAFKRMLSNLINNSVDALENKPNGKINLELRKGYQQTIVEITDNGKGIQEQELNKIKEGIEFSAGKKDGHGLGLTQVWEALNRNNAKLDIFSDYGEGTTILLRFPEIDKPSWIADEIKVYKGNTVVIVDDDESVHSAWGSRFKSIIEKIPEIKVKHFKKGLEAIGFINSHSDKEKEDIYLLTDYELLDQNLNGLEIIKQTNIKHALLVTSYYANVKIRELAINAQVKLLPKILAFKVKIKADKKLVHGSRIVDMVWLDDDKGFIDGIIKEEYKHLKVDTYGDPISFLEDVYQYPINTRIILDHYFYDFDINCELDGVKVAKELYDRGFNNLILTTGERPYQAVPDYLKIVLKKDLKKLYNLDKI